jgi:four helix bundle protein
MNFHDKLKLKLHLYAKEVYRVTKNFPKDELYGITSQLRRATLSIMLNYIEGFARRKGEKCKVYNNFLDISYGSFKESKYLIFFSSTENYINQQDYLKLINMADEIGGMIWSVRNTQHVTRST